MFYELIDKLDKKFKFATVSAYGAKEEKLSCSQPRAGQAVAKACRASLQFTQNRVGGTCVGGKF